MPTIEDRILILAEDKYKAETKLKAIAEKEGLTIDSSILKVANVLLDGALCYEVLIIVDGYCSPGQGKTIATAVENAITPSIPFMRMRSKGIENSVKELLS